MQKVGDAMQGVMGCQARGSRCKLKVRVSAGQAKGSGVPGKSRRCQAKG